MSRSLLTFPKQSGMDRREHLARWMQILIGVTGAALLTLCGWYAGHTSESVEHEHLITRMLQSERELSSSRLQVQEQQRQSARENAVLSASGQGTTVNQLLALQDRVRRLEAEVTEYKDMLAQSGRRADNRQDVLLLLQSPGAKLLPLKDVGSQSSAVAYGLLVPNSKLVFVASNLPDLSGGREFQLWMTGATDSPARNLGVFAPDAAGYAFLEVDDATMDSGTVTLFVTEEPAGGSSAPSGSKVMTSSSPGQ